MKIFRPLFIALLTLSFFIVSAQDSLATKKPEMADAFRANGKIYVVILVLAIILTGIFFYVYRLDRKITRLEKEGSKSN